MLLLGTSSSEGSVGGDIRLGNGLGAWDDWGLGDREGGVGGELLLSSLDLGIRGITLLWLAGLTWENDQLSLVLLESVDVGLESLDVSVLTTVVDSNTDGSGILFWNASSLELLKREASAESDLSVVLDGWGTDNWTKEVEWSRSQLGGTLCSVVSSADLLAWLVEVVFHSLLPVLLEVISDDGVILVDGHLSFVVVEGTVSI